MRYLLLTCIIFLFSCQQGKNEETPNSLVIPRLDTSTDTIVNGGILKFKGYLNFEPSLKSAEQSKSFINGWELRFDSMNNSDPYKHKHERLMLAELRGDTAYGNFMVYYPNIDSLPAFFEHSWTASLLVNFKTETQHSVDTTYIQEFTVTVKN